MLTVETSAKPIISQDPKIHETQMKKAAIFKSRPLPTANRHMRLWGKWTLLPSGLMMMFRCFIALAGTVRVDVGWACPGK